MTIILKQPDLSSALATLGKITDYKNTAPILSNALIRASGGFARIKTTNLDIEAEITIPCNGDFNACLDAETLKKITSSLIKGAEIGLSEKDGAQVALFSGGSKFKLNSLPNGDFPQKSKLDFSHTFTLPAPEFAMLLSRVQFSMGVNDSRYYLNGVFLELSASDLVAVAIDGHRISTNCIPAPEGCEGMPSIILPRDLIEIVIGVCKSGDLKVSLSDSSIQFEVGNTVIISKLIDATYTEYRRVIPTAPAQTIIVDRLTFLGAVSRAAALSDEKGRLVAIQFLDSKIEIQLNNKLQENSFEEIAADCLCDIRVGLNSKYLTDALNSISSDDVRIRVIDSNSPVVFQDMKDDDFLTLIMPMRV